MRQLLSRKTTGGFFNFHRPVFVSVGAGGSAFRGAESAHDKDDQAYQQHQAKPAATDDWTAKVKPAAAEQEKQNDHE